MRAIIRVSINGETNGVLRNALAAILTASGFALTRATATYENPNISIDDLANVMKRYWQAAADPSSLAGIQASAHMDHTWFYVDET